VFEAKSQDEATLPAFGFEVAILRNFTGFHVLQKVFYLCARVVAAIGNFAFVSMPQPLHSILRILLGISSFRGYYSCKTKILINSK